VHLLAGKGVLVRTTLAILVALFLGSSIFAQSPTGSIGGIVFDPDAKIVVGAEIIIVNDLTRVQYETKSNNEGIYAVQNLPPGPYRVQVSKIGFKTLIKPDIILNVQDAITLNFTLPIGAESIAVTVEGGAPIVNTQDATVSTVVDRQFAENLPLNGRSFQSLIQLTPGVVVTPVNSYDSGQFSVNGQRPTSNYWMVDGVGANLGISSGGLYSGNGLGGAVGSVSALGGTNSLVSVDALQEFRVQTSTFAPEFGRTPGAQISIVTRSGTNQFHGTAFDYLRNDVLDANNWFAESAGLHKPQERQNDFGGTLGGPILKDRTFFFFSYEGLRLRLPQTTLSTVPDLTARQKASPALAPYLNAFPMPNGTDTPATGSAGFNSSYSNPASVDAYSLRIDDNLSGKASLFGRYNYSPSQIALRGANGDSLNTIATTRITTQTLTVGATWQMTSHVTSDVRFNYSRVSASGQESLDGFGGAVPLATLPLPSPYTDQNSGFTFGIFSLVDGTLAQGTNGGNIQRQINLVGSFTAQKGTHSLRVGMDFRRLSPIQRPFLYEQAPFFLNVPSAETGNMAIGIIESSQHSTLLFRNLSLYAQDDWKATRRLTLTYGFRWDVDFPPKTLSGPSFAAVTGYNLHDPSTLGLAAPGTSLFATRYGNVAPRLGVAWQVSETPGWQTVLRSGFGVFYDLVDSEVGNIADAAHYPFGSSQLLFGPPFGGATTFPFNASEAAPPPITSTVIHAFDPNLQAPYTLQWNVALQQALGDQQAITGTYVGALGRRLLQTALLSSPNPTFSSAQLVGNTATSEYNALQVQFQRRLARGLQALASYTWSHSIDDASSGSLGAFSNTVVPGVSPSANRGPSDFDIRNAFSAGATYDIPTPKGPAAVRVLLRGWSAESIVQARSAAPVQVTVGASSLMNGGLAQIRPNLVAGIPLYLYGGQYPGGKALNNTPNEGGPGCLGPFCPPTPGQQGNIGRNGLRGFGASQWDLAVHRDFPIREQIKVQFRAEMFNVLNHPNFAPPVGDITQANFGLSTETLGQYLAGASPTGGGFNPLYQIGGPRSIQFAMKVIF
jgi:hypothetical protein